MRPLAISGLLLASLAGLALAPTASAAPPQPSCNGVWAATETLGPVAVFASPPCYEVSIDAMSCPVSPETWSEVRSGAIAVRVKACDRVEGAETDASAMAPPCTCPPPPRCNQVWTEGPLAGIVSDTITEDCRIVVAILRGTIACTDPLDGEKVLTQGRISVILPCGQIDYCEPPFECYPASTQPVLPPICGPTAMCAEPGLPAAVLIPPVCIWKEAAIGNLAKAGFDQCRQSHETFPPCSSPQRIHEYEQVAWLYAQVDLCLPHGPPPTLASAAAAVEPPVCGPDMRCEGPSCPARSVGSTVDHENSVTLNEDCTIDIVTGRGQVCVGAWSGYEQRVVGPVTWDRYYCRFPGGDPLDLSLTMGNPGPCGATDPTQRCPAPQPIRPCDDLPVAAATSAAQPSPASVSYTLSPECDLDVYVAVLPGAIQCLFGEGYNKAFQQGPVTVWTWGCRPPPQPPVE